MINLANGSDMYQAQTRIPDDERSQETALCSTNNGLVQINPLDLCFIDEETARTLELVQNNVDTSNKKHSLLGYLNLHTSTTTGARLLKHSILNPLCNFEILDHRLDCVEFLVNRIDTLATITNGIRRFGVCIDLDNVVPNLITLYKNRAPTLGVAEKKLDTLVTLESLINQVSPLVATLDAAGQATLTIYKVTLQDPAYDEIISEINNVIESDIRPGKAKRNKVFQIRRGCVSLFDVARSTYTAAINDLEQYVRDLQKEDSLPWKLSYSVTRGYYLALHPNHLPKDHVLGPRYIRVQKNRSLISATTKELMQSNVRANVSYENSMRLANEILTECLEKIMKHTPAISKLVDIIGMLDLISCFARLAVKSNGTLVRPRYSASETILERSKHPVLESVLASSNLQVVPNDITLSTGNKNFMLVTGPNMGGKSILLKQVGVIQVMSQIGCYVPAESARIRIVNRIVARSGTTEDHQSNCSSFMSEMKGIASALKTNERVQDSSTLFLIDEVGRGTTIDDGASYSFSIAEELALRKYCFTIFATHFDQVFYLTSLYSNVLAYHFKAEDVPNNDPEGDSDIILRMTHELVPGFAHNSHYGLKMAESCGMPKEIMHYAKSDLGYVI